MTKKIRPLIIGLPTDVKKIGPHNFHCAGEKYIKAIVDIVEGLPLLIPSLGDDLDINVVLDQIDGLLLTGGYANIEPHRYGDGDPYEGCMLDPARDATTLKLIPEAIKRGIPILGVCRGMQELNVAMGGSLYQQVQEVPGYSDHREDTTQSLETQYAPVHEVYPEAGGILFEITSGTAVKVNSLHGQGIKVLGDDLEIECKAPDGLIEGIRYKDSNSFVLAVQWHPEWKATQNPFYSAIFSRFKDACRERIA